MMILKMTDIRPFSTTFEFFSHLILSITHEIGSETSMFKETETHINYFFKVKRQQGGHRCELT